MLVLCEKLADMHGDLYGYERKIGTDELVSFIKLEYGRIGADQNITPREVIRDFIELLDLLYPSALPPREFVPVLPEFFHPLSAGSPHTTQSPAYPARSPGCPGEK